MSVIKYRTDSYDTKIIRLVFARETESSLFNERGQRVAKESGYRKHHDSWEAAHAYLIDRATRRLESARNSLQQAQGELGNLKGMKKPD